MFWFWCFMIYSFLGFLLETAFAAATGGRAERKCRFFLPVCPVYGAGAVLLALLPAAVRENAALLLPCAALTASAAEYAAGTFYARALGVRFWDYSALPLNLGGQVCLYFSLAWGALALVFLRVIHPPVAALVSRLPDWSAWPLLALFLCDTALSYRLLRRFRDVRCLRGSAEYL